MIKPFMNLDEVEFDDIEDVITCPPGGPDVAHQIINTGKTTMRYLSLSILSEVDVCEYPDSRKILVVAGQQRNTLCKKA